MGEVKSSRELSFPLAIRRGSCVVKIYRDRRPEKDYFRVVYHLAGKRHRLNFNSLEDARREAEAKAAMLARGDVDAAQLSGRDRLIYGRALEAVSRFAEPLDGIAIEYADARRRLGNKPLAEAVDFYLRHHQGIMAHVTVSSAVEEFLRDKRECGLSTVYIQDLTYRLKKLSTYFECTLADITVDAIRDFFAGLKLSPRGHNNCLATLGVFFGYCQRRKWLPKESDLLEGIGKRKESRAPVEILTPGEVKALLGACSPELAAALALVAFGGVRMEEVLRLVWEDTYRRPGFIEIEAAKAKTARRRLMPLLPNLADWLQRPQRQTGPIWPHSKAYLFEALRDAVESAGLKWKRNALRHSFVSYRLADVRSKHQVAEEAGNSPAMIDRSYRELVTPDEAEAWFRIHPEEMGGTVIPFRIHNSI